jgi:hypothetical protein
MVEVSLRSAKVLIVADDESASFFERFLTLESLLVLLLCLGGSDDKVGQVAFSFANDGISLSG